MHSALPDMLPVFLRKGQAGGPSAVILAWGRRGDDVCEPKVERSGSIATNGFSNMDRQRLLINHIPDEDLRLEHLPAPGARKAALIDFAHTYNAYEVHGSFERVSEAHRRVMFGGRLTLGQPGSLADIRAALFFVERGAYHSGWVSHFEEAQMRALVEAIRLELYHRGYAPPGVPK